MAVSIDISRNSVLTQAVQGFEVNFWRCLIGFFSRFVTWGDGEMGRWGDGEMGRWGDLGTSRIVGWAVARIAKIWQAWGIYH
ncbi:hypothetical protein LYNGBM3L_14580, partial [Moorena producens 3L]